MTMAREFDFPTVNEPFLHATICQICREPLSRVNELLRNEAGQMEEHVGPWQHRTETDHDVVAVGADPSGEAVAARCDVCSVAAPQWLVPTRADASFTALVTGPVQVQTRDIAPVWLVCDDCAVLVRAADAQGLTRRAMGMVEEPGHREVRAALYQFQVHFLNSIVGPPERLVAPPDTSGTTT